MSVSLNAKRRLVVFDDDPTGVQTVHDCLVLSRWDPESVRRALGDDVPFFFILTNTRALTRDQAAAVVREAAINVAEAARDLGVELLFVSRSDSTLRSHFPLELDTLCDAAGTRPDVRFFVPAFFEGGRITRNDTHYIVEGNTLTPCHETEFARDSVFGYRTAYLPQYIADKTGVAPSNVGSLSFGGVGKNGQSPADNSSVATGKAYTIVNVENYSHLAELAGLTESLLESGQTVVFHGAASLVKVLTGTPDKALYRRSSSARAPGLIIVGSHVKKSTAQLRRLLEGSSDLVPRELSVSAILDDSYYLDKELNAMTKAAAEGKTPVIYTERSELSFPSTESRLDAGQKISDFTSALVRRCPYTPAYCLAKGGITSHDVMMKGLDLTCARVWGQVSPGVPLLTMPDDHRWPQMPYVIFPGNVGNEETLRDVYKRLSGKGE